MQSDARECYNNSIKVASKERKLPQTMVIIEKPSSGGYVDDTLDPRTQEEEIASGPVEELVALPVDLKDATKILKLGRNLSKENSTMLANFLKANLDVFA